MQCSNADNLAGQIIVFPLPDNLNLDNNYLTPFEQAVATLKATINLSSVVLIIMEVGIFKKEDLQSFLFEFKTVS